MSSLAMKAWWAEARTKSAMQDSRLLFAGTQTGPSSKGIYGFHWDPASGELKELGLAAESNNPTFIALSPDGKHLYAANELDEYEGAKSGSVSGFIIDRAAAKLTHINTVSSAGAGPCFVGLDHTGHALFCADYAGGAAASFHIDQTGSISEAVSQFHYQGRGPAVQQEAAHAHRATVTPENRYVLINDLGLDCIHIYHLDAETAKLTPNNPPQWTAKPGSGPRALRFHPNGKWAYCLNEIASTIDVLAWDGKTGALTSLQHIDTLPKDYRGQAAASEIVIDSSGRFAYAAVRFWDRVVTYSIDPATGSLSQIGVTSCGSKVPRHMTLDPTEKWLLVANQGSDNIAVIQRDAQTGKLAEAGNSFPLVKPQCLVFV
ncbi:lactonase family protein [Alloacidobacterium sp.]|uniref:lactonase family protein n=1 Tax=Alloacidobacterium sp. TaxID=2951999 RepID=UPI002D681086|nr:lactonase family protein [Alloacidobacterium sp.]HYK37694.1 lactonase family protein [Alloacidobacterium sp.]